MRSLLSLERFEGLSVFGMNSYYLKGLFYHWCSKLLHMYMSYVPCSFSLFSARPKEMTLSKRKEMSLKTLWMKKMTVYR